MIKLTRIHGEIVYVNEDNIQWIECMPDTTITFINGNKFIVKEDIEKVISLIKENLVSVHRSSAGENAPPEDFSQLSINSPEKLDTSKSFMS